MGIIAGFMVPHPPLIVPEIGRGEEKQIELTTKSYQEVAKQIARLKPETIIISSPHTRYYSDCFYVSGNDWMTGDFGRFGAKEVCFKEEIDKYLVKEIEELSIDKGLPVLVDDDVLDHGTMVPLYFIRKELPETKIVVVGLSSLSLIENYQFGTIIKAAVDKLNKKVVFVASGDLSHKLQEYGPYGFIEEGPEYDKRIMDTMSKGNFKELLEYDEEFLDKASECGHRSFTIMAGALDGIKVKSEDLSHEDITGVGYGICTFYPQEEDKNGSLLDKYVVNESNDEYVKLARKSIENHILNKDNNLLDGVAQELLDNKRGVFVSIHKFNNLRGCIGTIIPTADCVAKEIINNAVEASSNDPRFEPITQDELKYLEIKVDVLSPLEDIISKDMLDPKKYGVIVSSGYKRGVLLPDLEGIDDVDTQIDIAMKKAGISNNEKIKLQRFTVSRHK